YSRSRTSFAATASRIATSRSAMARISLPWAISGQARDAHPVRGTAAAAEIDRARRRDQDDAGLFCQRPEKAADKVRGELARLDKRLRRNHHIAPDQRHHRFHFADLLHVRAHVI